MMCGVMCTDMEMMEIGMWMKKENGVVILYVVMGRFRGFITHVMTRSKEGVSMLTYNAAPSTKTKSGKMDEKVLFWSKLVVKPILIFPGAALPPLILIKPNNNGWMLLLRWLRKCWHWASYGDPIARVGMVGNAWENVGWVVEVLFSSPKTVLHGILS